MKTKILLKDIESAVKAKSRDIKLYHCKMKAISKEARETREAFKLSCRAVAKEMNISSAYLSDMERGVRYFTVDSARDFNTSLQLLKHRKNA